MNKNKVLKDYNAFYVLSMLSVLLDNDNKYTIIHNKDNSQIMIKKEK